jgi:hypothetical protein
LPAELRADAPSSAKPAGARDVEWTDPMLTNVRTNKLQDIAKGEGALVYRGYKVTAHIDPKSIRSIVTVRRGRRLLVRLDEDATSAWLRPAVQIALYRILGKRAKQLIVSQDSGGAHCCYSLMIYDLLPRFRMIYDSRKDPVGDTWNDIQFFDLDRDGVLEFKQDLLTFADDFEGLPNVSSPRVPMFFKYYPRLGKYCPANHLFPSFALRGIAAEKQAVKEYNLGNDQDWVFSLDLLDVVLRLIYAGKEGMAWTYFDKQYRSSSVSKRDMKRDIRKLLRKDPVYRFLYNPAK